MVIFFDIDDTLVNSKSAHWKAMGEISRAYGFPENKIDQNFQKWLSITNHYLKLYFEKKISLEQQRIFRIREFWQYNNKQISEEQTLPVYQRYHHLFLQNCTSFSDTVSTLDRLKSNNLKLGIISNGTYPDQIQKLEDNHLSCFFDEIIISEKVGYFKPDKEIFQIAAQQIGASLPDCTYIGDSYELDYLGSLHSGMKGIWLDRDRSAVSPHCVRIHSLSELEDLIHTQ